MFWCACLSRGEGRVIYIFVQIWDNEAPTAAFFWGLSKGGKFFSTPCVYSEILRFLWRLEICVKNTKIISTPDLSSKLALGCWPIHLSSVTYHLSRGGGVEHGGLPLAIWPGPHQ